MNASPRLWSLWEMLEFEAHSFVRALAAISDMEAIGRQDAAWVYGTPDRVHSMVLNLNVIRMACEDMGLKQSTRKAKSLADMLANKATNYEHSALAAFVTNQVTELRDRITGELEEHAIYQVEPNKVGYLKLGATPFGDKVSDTFYGTAEDISEAAMCIAFSRNTAAIFHLMRVMETAVKRLGEGLNCTVIDKNNVDLEWGKILGNIRDKVEGMDKGERRDEWSEVVTLLYHVKQAWRNPTMHPKKTYTDGEVVSAFGAVKSFTQRLSELVASP